jgi:hypothetical protein
MSTLAGKPGDIDIIQQALGLAETVATFVAHARRFYYEVMLSGFSCKRCGGALEMIAESRCRCRGCGNTFDPTVAFQRCGACGGAPQLRICRYQCRQCQRDVPSRFVFDGLVFDREYFRERMAESRERKAQRHQEVRQQVQDSRSLPLEIPLAAELGSIPGLLEALNDLVGTADVTAWLPLCKGLDLNRYQGHLQALIGRWEMDFDDIPALEEDRRLDRIWRFVTIIFMAHAGLIEIRQEGHTILLRKKTEDETDHEG